MEQMLLFIFLCEIFCSFAHAKCYFPNGLELPGDFHPCENGKEFKMCCAPRDSCRSDGLCYNNVNGLIYRDGCTDQSWESPSCIKLCNTGLGPTDDGTGVMDLTANTIAITICENGSYCCGDGAFGSTCCTRKQGVFLANGSITQQNPLNPSIFTSIISLSLSTSMTTAAPTAFSSTFPSETLSTISTANKAALATRTIVGGAVGGFAGVALLLLGIWIWKRRNRRIAQDRRNGMLQWDATSNTDSRPGLRHEADVQNIAELSDDHGIPEIGGPDLIFELSDDHGIREIGGPDLIAELSDDHGIQEIGGPDLIFELDPSREWHEMH